MFNRAITLLLIFLILFTPIAFGAMELWAFSVMELGILFIIILWSLQSLIPRTPTSPPVRQAGELHTFNPQLKILNSPLTIVLLSLFLLLILFQMISLPSGILKIISPKTFALRQSLSISNFELSALS